jgi:NADH:ubiquinone oxidoreductase subunit F (NADH-binding)
MNHGLRPITLGALTNALERHGLHGRGGASFPTATKLRAVAAERGTPIVVVNAAEGEPLSDKDSYLLTERLPTIVDGAVAAAIAVGADEVIIAVKETYRAQIKVIAHVVEQRPEVRNRKLTISVRPVPVGYVTGQETALISALAGGAAKPTATPPYPFQKGLAGRPTLVSNAETFSHVGRIVRGTYDGRRLISVGGSVSAPGLLEVGDGTPLTELCQAAGGFIEPVRGVLLGGYGGTWVDPSDIADLALSEPRLRERQLTLGAGIVFVLGESACPVAEVASVVRWMAGQSAGQCGPCIHGLDALAAALVELSMPGPSPGSLSHIERWAVMIQRRGACAHPDGVSRFIATALRVFSPEFVTHASRGRCQGCRGMRVLPIPNERRRHRDSGGRRQPASATGFREQAAAR